MKNLSDLKNDRDVFEYIVAHLLEQGEKSSEEGTCLYRAPGERSCAVGCLIADEHYDFQFEGVNADDSRVEAAVRASIGFQPSDELTIDMQKLHDNWEPEQWERLIEDLRNSIKFTKSGDFEWIDEELVEKLSGGG